MAASHTAPRKIPRLNRFTDTLTSAERWQAITKRDTTVNSFVYAVLTTKIYCRPSCGARLARRANVEFYDTPPQAEKAGFRPCKRCRPQNGGTAAQSNPQAMMVEQTCKIIREQVAAGLKPRLNDLAVHAGLTPSHFHRVFKKLLGVTPGQYVDSVVQNGLCLSPETLSEGTLSEFETSMTPLTAMSSPLGFVGDGMELNLDIGRGCALHDKTPAARLGEISPGFAEDWNEFDVLLAAEEKGGSLGSVYIDPRILSAP
ncbi:Ada DNA repair metal-binding [Penicillium angulare]|uniref:Ada DNA repair metal-binding n=1 Tax=Penicillium angulare TaxID=116970 RepID=A0A9W9KJX4_9EURO|nr:Ada DNA repair metal-binding [Penicillium angulare]